MSDILDISKNIIDTSNDEQAKREKRKEMLLQMIMRQTNYTKEEAIENLKRWNYNTLYVMKAYLNPEFYKKKIEEPKSTNQRMMREIRSFCDKGTRLYNLRKNMMQQQNMIQSIAAQQQLQLQQQQNETENIVIEID